MKITTSKNPTNGKPVLLIEPENHGDKLQIDKIKDNLSIPTGEHFHEWENEDRTTSGITIFIDTLPH